ncbi:MAG: HlyC/CorC family transporter [Pseudomonadota bacterium]
MSAETPLGLLFGLIAILLAMSAFFSSSETALMSLNRYRLRHRAKDGHRPSQLAEQILARPDRLIGLILLGNNLVNFSASTLTAIIALRIGGESAAATASALGTVILTLVVLIFAEVAPKTMAALYPERIALPAAYVYYPLLKICMPIVRLINLAANGVLLLFGIRTSESTGDALSREELRTVVTEAGAMLSARYRRMLVSILDLEKVTVDDVMVSRNLIVGIDLTDDIDDIVEQLEGSDHTRLPVYRDNIDNIIGILHLRQVVNALRKKQLTKDLLVTLLTEPYFVPEGTALSRQLVQFQKQKRRVGMVVDEYGDLQGMVTLEDILEEIVGEFTTAPGGDDDDIVRIGPNAFQASGTAHVRELNRLADWVLPTDGPKTLNGLIVETLETIPVSGTTLTLDNYRFEIIETSDNRVQRLRVYRD